MIRDHFVYRTYSADGELLYVGCTKRLDVRWREHHLERSGMVARTVRCKLVGPLTREVARRLEREAIRSEQPLFGWTPEKGAEKRLRSAWINRRAQELMASGVSMTAAVQSSVGEAEEWFPHPDAHEFDEVSA